MVETSNSNDRALDHAPQYMEGLMEVAALDAVLSYKLTPGSVTDVVGFAYEGFRSSEFDIVTLLILDRSKVGETNVFADPDQEFIAVRVNEGYAIPAQGRLLRTKFQSSTVWSAPTLPGPGDLENALETGGKQLYRLDPLSLFRLYTF